MFSFSANIETVQVILSVFRFCFRIWCSLLSIRRSMICMCIYICVYIYMYMCIYIYMCVQRSMTLYIYMCTKKHDFKRIYIYTVEHVYMIICTLKHQVQNKNVQYRLEHWGHFLWESARTDKFPLALRNVAKTKRSWKSFMFTRAVLTPCDRNRRGRGRGFVWCPVPCKNWIEEGLLSVF